MSIYSKLKSKSKDRLSFWLESAKQDFMIAVHSAMSRKKISSVRLSEKIGCSPAYVSKVLKGDANVTIETMVKFARALDSELCIHIADANESIRWFGIATSTRNTHKEKPQASHAPAFWAVPGRALGRERIANHG